MTKKKAQLTFTHIDLIQARRNAGHNQDEAALEMGMNSSSVSNFERMKTKRPHKLSRETIAKYIKKYRGGIENISPQKR